MGKMGSPIFQVFISANKKSLSTEKHVLLIFLLLECLISTEFIITGRVRSSVSDLWGCILKKNNTNGI